MINDILNKFKEKPYMLDMGAGTLAKRLMCTIEDIKEAKGIIRNDGFSLEKECEANGINPKNVDGYWYKSKHYSIKVKNKTLNPEIQFKTLLEECKKEARLIKGFEANNDINESNCAIINIYDLHLDKININSNLDAKEQLDNVESEIKISFSKLLKSSLNHNPTLFILPVGNDIFCTNGFEKTTKKGTPQNTLVNHEIVFRRGLELIRQMIDTLSSHGKVKVPIIYGNHDADAVWYLGVALEILYENNDNVDVDNNRKARKYIEFRENLFGFGHGDKEKKFIEKLPLIMATQEPEKWGRTTYREFFLGDLHHEMEYKFFRTKDNPGCRVRFLRSAGVDDVWHDDNGLVGVPRSIETYIFNKFSGQIANYSLNI